MVVNRGQGVYTHWDITRRYLGTYYCATANQLQDTQQFRHLWNNDNRVVRHLFLAESAPHVYNGVVWRAWNNNTAYNVQYVNGIVEDAVWLHLQESSNGGVGASYGCGFGPAIGTVIVYISAPNTTPWATRLVTSAVIQPTPGMTAQYVQEVTSGANCDFNDFKFTGGVLA